MPRDVVATLALTVFIGIVVAVLVFSLLRLGAAARRGRRQGHSGPNEAAFVSATLQDAVSKLRAQERAMTARAEASERLSGEIIVSMAAGLLVVGVDGAVRIVNPAGRRLLGLADADLAGRFRPLLAHAGPVAEAIEECLVTGAPILRRTLTMPDPQRTASHLGVTVSPIVDGAGQLNGAICLFADLSAFVDLEEQLRLKDSLARLGELTAGIAHEFRNSLATIHGYSRLLDLEKIPPAFRPYVEGIRQETDSLRQVVTNFLNFARPVDLTVTPVDLRTVSERAADEARPEARARGGEISVHGEFATIEGDEVLLRQAFSNLLRNAVEACAGASIPPAVVIEGRIDLAQGVSRITVLDNGPGIDPAVRERIFRPFFTCKAGGTGLGLALVQKIVVSHNGRVTAGSAPGGGASLQIVLPLATPNQSA